MYCLINKRKLIISMYTKDEVIIKFSKWKLVWFTAMVLVVIGGIFSLLQNGGVIKYVMSIVSLIISALLAYQEYWYLLELRKRQIVISINGITARDGEFYAWQEVSNEKLMQVGSVKPTWFLWFETPGRSRKLHLDGLDKSPEQIMALFKTYRQAASSLNNIRPLRINDVSNE